MNGSEQSKGQPLCFAALGFALALVPVIGTRSEVTYAVATSSIAKLGRASQ